MTLTPAKENAGEECKDVEEEDEEVTLVDDGEIDAPRKPLLWEVELLMTEQKEEYDEKDPEYVPPSTCLDISLDYDEYSDGEAEISDEEVQSLKVDLLQPPPVPSDYIAVWVKVDSPCERISKAKEEHGGSSADNEEHEGPAKGETSGKETVAEVKVGDSDSTSTLESDGARKKSLSVDGNSSCSNLTAGSSFRRKSASAKSSCSEAEPIVKPPREKKESVSSQLEVLLFLILKPAWYTGTELFLIPASRRIY